MDVAGSLDAFLRNFRYAIRTLAKLPAFSATVVLTLALGIGANSAVFSAIYAVLLRPLPFPDGDQLVELSQSNRRNPQTRVAPVRLQDWNRLNSAFQAITGYYTQDDSELSGELPEKIKRALVAPRFLQVWGVAPALGRDFRPEEERFGGPDAILISDRLWRRRFGADPNTAGKRLRLGASSFTIVGIMPASFLFPDRGVDLWSPSPMDAPYSQNRESTWFMTIGRLKPGFTLEQARANLATVQANLGRLHPKTDAEIGADIQPLKETIVGGVRGSLWVLFGSVSMLLLIACTNIAALLLSRATQRQHEISLRFSLGASRASVVAQLLTEAFVLALAGALLGLFVAAGASRVFRALAANLPRIAEITLDWRIVLYSLACAVAATLLCGLFPAIRCTRRNLFGSLAQAGRTQVSARNPVQLLLVGVQVALAVTLLAGAGLLLRSFQELGRVAPGFDPAHILTFHISTSWGETADMGAVRQRTERILDFLRSVPGVETAATAVTIPGVPNQYQLELKVAEGRAETDPKVIAESRFVSPGYFATLRIPLLAGELCSDGPNSKSVVVNRSFANTYFMGSSAIGHHLQRTNVPISPAVEIRGIVGDARESGIHRQPVPTVYWCYGAAEPGTFFLVRTRVPPMAMVETIRRKIHEIEPRRSVFDFTLLEEHISDGLAEDRLRTFLLAFFAITAVSLACVGLYGTLSYLVNMRKREIGLRLALGALRGQIVTNFLVQGLGVSFLGCIAGLVLASASAHLLSGMLYGVTPSDTTTLTGVVLIVLAVAMIGSLLPAIRASRLQPMQVLRDE
jgi:putative ABC transport system permease protein